MLEEPRADVAPPRCSRSWLAWLGLPLAIGGFAALDVSMKSRPATASARAFVGAVRADRASEVRAHATEQLARRLETRGERRVARANLRAGAGVAGDRRRLRGRVDARCIDGRIGEHRVWFLMVKEHGAWLVADLRPAPRPSECEFE